MIITTDNGLAPYLTFWRGDIRAEAFTLRVVNTTTEVVTIFDGLTDVTPDRLTIMLAPDNEVWDALPNGEYEYYVEVRGRIVSAGLLRNIKRERVYEYETGEKFYEYDSGDYYQSYREA